MKLSAVVFTIILVAAAASCPAADRWTPPSLAPPPAQLPQLGPTLKLDGSLAEWGGAACVPVSGLSYISVLNKPHTWNGPSDASMEFHCAWSAEGVCVAAVVADDDVRNNREGKDIWQQDSIEVYLDGRAPGRFMTSPYSAGAYQLLIRPPVNGKGAEIAVNPRDGQIDGLKVAGKRTATGYSVEALVPWSAFPGLSAAPGANLGLQFGLNDYDSRDDRSKPCMLTYLGQIDLWQAPQNMTKWTLVQKLDPAAPTALAPIARLDVPRMHVNTKPVSMQVATGSSLALRAASVRVTAKGFDGETVFTQTSGLSAQPAPWEGSAAARIDWPSTKLPDGWYTVTAEVRDKGGRPLAVSTRPVMLLGSTEREAVARIKRADVARLSQTQPFKAASYLGAAVCVERIKRGIELMNPTTIARAAIEVSARLDVLEGRTVARSEQAMDLLNLTADPESPVVVEYPEPHRAVVTLQWGSIPLVKATVTRTGADDAAEAAQAPAKGPFWQVRAASGDRLIEAESPSREVAERAVALVAAGKPVTTADLDAMRSELVKTLTTGAKPAAVPAGMSLYCGDLHMHSFYSDGTPSPVGLVLQAMYCRMDYAAVTDHNTIAGAQLGQKLFARHGVAFPYIVGEEVTTPWSHLNAYPVRELVSWELSPYETVKAAHAQGAVVQWNHPHAVDSEWMRANIDMALRGTSIDAWEHVPQRYDEWKAAGKLPVITGTTDAHDGTFSYERTIVFAPSPQGDDVAEAIRAGRVVALSLHDPYLLYGSHDTIAAVTGALAQGDALKAAKARQIREALRRADIPGLLNASVPRP